MITPIRHPKLHKDIAYLHSKSEATHECVSKTENKNEYKGITTNQSASANFEGGFFSPKNRDSVSFSGGKDGGFWHNFGQRESVKNFFKNSKFIKFLEKTSGLAMMEAYFVFGISTTLKPVSIELMPGSKKEDKDLNATKSFLAGVVDFGLAQIALKPVEHKLEDFGHDIFGKIDKKGKVEKLPNEKLLKEIQEKVPYLKNKTNFSNFKKVVGYMPKYGLAPIRSLLTIALIPPTLKILFPNAKKFKSEKETKQLTKVAQAPQINKPGREITQITPERKKVLAGGVR